WGCGLSSSLQCSVRGRMRSSAKTVRPLTLASASTFGSGLPITRCVVTGVHCHWDWTGTRPRSGWDGAIHRAAGGRRAERGERVLSTPPERAQASVALTRPGGGAEPPSENEREHGAPRVSTHPLRSQLDGLDDLHVAGAAAEVAAQRVLDLVAVRGRIVVKQ